MQVIIGAYFKNVRQVRQVRPISLINVGLTHHRQTSLADGSQKEYDYD